VDDITVAVSTYGERKWVRLALERAIPSAQKQGVPVIHYHGATLADARNQCLARVSTDFAIHLDADDRLRAGYVEAMARGTADLRGPAVQYWKQGGRAARPYIPRVAGHQHACSADCITSGAGNWLAIGTCARTAQLREAGGWRDYPCYEDFDLWMRVLLRGATVEAIPDAVYEACHRSDSRNRGPDMRFKNGVHHQIVAANLP